MRGNIKKGLITIFLLVNLLFSPLYYGCNKSSIDDIDIDDTDITEISNLAKSKGNSIQIDPYALYSFGITPVNLLQILKGQHKIRPLFRSQLLEWE